jgi:hypothetical protein
MPLNGGEIYIYNDKKNEKVGCYLSPVSLNSACASRRLQLQPEKAQGVLLVLG